MRLGEGRGRSWGGSGGGSGPRSDIPPPSPPFPLCRIRIQKDTKIASAATFVVLCEDHTLGNIARM